ncbi:cysteinyl-tRNA synthetase [Emydomyces testavorans]|uniref:cysteine--tRNA ligase n=1 Tax=Emydomyces testavorans TaxID=2070801 RepID=A0AAF0DCK9_9EURO|nr:cysteinyl-tRNA synthetase [Emydomyces testavorans]
MAAPREQPPWKQPSSNPESTSKLPPLKVWNSLTRSKVPFIPIDPNGKKITWYACGPTVYDDAHLGHARNYVSTDILRRLLRDYFKFDVRFVMNITDVDDKIITRARQQHLFMEYVTSHPTIDDSVLETITSAYVAYVKKNLPLLENVPTPKRFSEEVQEKYAFIINGGAFGGSNKPGDKEAKVKMHIKTATSAAKALADIVSDKDSMLSETFYDLVQDVVLPYLDALKGSSIRGEEYSIFTKLTKRFEDRFMEDARALNILDADEITRVTEFVPEIVSFVEQIVQHNFAYVTSDGSVYFDIAGFEAVGNHYARLEPWNRNDTTLQADGEGALINKTVEKRSKADFALWKASKAGEPSWPSPWGPGRPGWHIECSVMASSRLGKQMDIHSGGIDLAFPHHDNELAQSEAYWHKGCSHDQWVNYFLHMGHLSIQGSKMSKSLKNFTTIREALERGDWTPRSLRIVFLLGNWADGIEITEDLVKAGNAWEEKLNNFFLNIRNLPVENGTSSSSTDDSLADRLKAAQKAVDDNLCDSFNTLGAMMAISELVTHYNSTDKSKLNGQHIQEVAKWVTSMINIFGLNGSAAPDSEEIGWSGIEIPEVAKPYLFPLSSMRDVLRETARGKAGISVDTIKSVAAKGDEVLKQNAQPSDEAKPYKQVLSDFCTKLESLEPSESLSKEILTLCDRLRDVDLFDLGVYLEDRHEQPALVRTVSRELMAAREEKVARARKKQLEKEAREKEARERAEKGRLSHLLMFRTNEFSAWDDNGIPVKDAAGEDLTKSKAKKLRKEWEKQKKEHEAWLAKQNGS